MLGVTEELILDLLRRAFHPFPNALAPRRRIAFANGIALTPGALRWKRQMDANTTG
jgi:hypothetical protein